MVELSEETWRRVRKIFPKEYQGVVAELLERECADNVQRGRDMFQLERVRFAALKMGGGDVDGLRKAVALAKRDWRDLLVGAGFGHDVDAHKSWLAE